MASRRCRLRTSPVLGPLENDDLLGEIFLRLPLKPSSLLRACLVCKRWRSIVTDAAFCRRFRTHHRKPPILGIFEQCPGELKFRPLLDPPDRIPSGRFSLYISDDKFYSWIMLGCRHGRVLLINWQRRLLLVFEPVSGDTLRILIPPEFSTVNGTVLCAAGDDQDHVHGECHSSPFKVVLVGNRNHQNGALVYSSQTGVWGDLVPTKERGTGGISCRPATLVGNVLYWYLIGSVVGILRFDLDNQSLTVIARPTVAAVCRQTETIRAEDGGLGLAILSYPTFQLWGRKVDPRGVATWVLRKKVDMDKMLGPMAASARIVGYAEDADTIFMSMYQAPDSRTSRHVLAVVHLESMKVQKYRGSFYGHYHPFTNFYAPGIGRE